MPLLSQKNHPHPNPLPEYRERGSEDQSIGIAPALDGVDEMVRAARTAQGDWSRHPLRARLALLRQLRHRLAERGDELAALLVHRHRSAADAYISEVLPLADAIRFLERLAPRLLRPSRWGARFRPLWLWGTRLTVHREPVGVVLVVSPANYPLLLLGVQAAQALAAGNAVLIKPAPQCSAVARMFQQLAIAAGIAPQLIQILPEATDAVPAALQAGIDKLLFTGSSHNGRAILALAASHGVPVVVELSGHDSVFVLDDADLRLAARGVAFGVRFNGGATCVAPRRVLVAATRFDPFMAELNAISNGHPGIDVIPVQNLEDALQLQRECAFKLGAVIFGHRQAGWLAQRIDAGVVVVNDLLAPHADPRLPLAGRGASGFGVTRGAEGLLELTRPKAVSVRAGRFRPHFDPPPAGLDDLFRQQLAASHASTARQRIHAMIRLIGAGRRMSKQGSGQQP
jgi:acyl-CoA reductase-like NAD-dependent aldehyde dehydrogenase